VRRLKGILHVAARGFDGRRGYIVQGAVASFLGRGDAVTVNIFEASGWECR